MATDFQFDPSDRKKKRRWITALLLLPLLVSVSLLLIALVSVFQVSNRLMSLPGEEFNVIASHLMPSYDEVRFKTHQSDLYLSGWFFKARQEARANILLIHPNGGNRLIFGMESAALIERLIQDNFNVFTFDQRHSGLSDGSQSSFGFAEYHDVLAALETVARISGRRDFILYGFGSGTTAALLTWNELPDRLAADPGADYTEETLFRDDIKAFIFDTPAASAYDYIRAEINPEGILNQRLYLPYVPLALRLASGGSELTNLIPLVSQIQSPVMITRNLPDTLISAESLDAFSRERLRLNPATTFIRETKMPGHLNGFLLQTEDYLNDLSLFLNQWFD